MLIRKICDNKRWMLLFFLNTKPLMGNGNFIIVSSNFLLDFKNEQRIGTSDRWHNETNVVSTLANPASTTETFNDVSTLRKPYKCNHNPIYCCEISITCGRRPNSLV